MVSELLIAPGVPFKHKASSFTVCSRVNRLSIAMAPGSIEDGCKSLMTYSLDRDTLSDVNVPFAVHINLPLRM